MGYHIEYPSSQKCYSREHSGVRIAALTGLFLLIFLIAAHSFWPDGRQIIWSFLLPGDSTVTASALEEMILSLKEGENLQTCLTVFCRQILDGAEFAAY